MTALSIPYRFDGVTSVRGTRKTVRPTRTVDVEIPDHGYPERHFTMTFHNQPLNAKLVEDRIWLPVCKLGERNGVRWTWSTTGIPEEELGDIAILASTSPAFVLGPHSPLSTPEFGTWESGKLVDLKKKLPKRPEEIDLEDDGPEERARAAALRDAGDLCLIEGRLHTARFELMPVKFDPCATTFGWMFVDSRPDLYATQNFGKVTLSSTDVSDKAECLGLRNPVETLPDDMRPVFELGLEQRHADFDHAMLRLVRQRVTAIFPNRGHDCLIGAGTLGTPDIPRDLEELGFDGRRILRRLLPVVEDGKDIEPMLSELEGWLEKGEEVLDRVDPKGKASRRPANAFATSYREGMGRWWRNIERPRRLSTQMQIPNEDLDAFSGFTP